MMKMKTLTAMVLLLGLGCGSAPASRQPTLRDHFAGAPEWVSDCRARFGSRRNVICGVGMVAGVRDPWLARSAAEGRGRAEIIRALRLRHADLGKDTGNAVSVDGADLGRQSSEEQYLQQVLEELAEGTIAGTRRDSQWVSETGAMFVLVVLEPEAFLGAVQRMNRLDAETRRAVVERAATAFRELEARTSIGDKESQAR